MSANSYLSNESVTFLESDFSPDVTVTVIVDVLFSVVGIYNNLPGSTNLIFSYPDTEYVIVVLYKSSDVGYTLVPTPSNFSSLNCERTFLIISSSLRLCEVITTSTDTSSSPKTALTVNIAFFSASTGVIVNLFSEIVAPSPLIEYVKVLPLAPVAGRSTVAVLA